MVCGFLRISTNARGFKNPMTPAEASQQVRSWLAQPGVPLLEPRAELIEPVLQSLVKLGPAGNLVTAAQSAALAGGHEATLDTNDTDFMRFSGWRWCNPLTDSARAKRRKTCNPGRTTAPSARLPGAGIFAASSHRDLAKVRLSAMGSAGRAGRRRPRRRGTLPLPV